MKVGNALHAIRFTSEITLGSVMTIAIMLMMAVEVLIFYDVVMGKISEARLFQNDNKVSIERLSGDLASYKHWSYEQSQGLAKDVREIQADLIRLQADMQKHK